MSILFCDFIKKYHIANLNKKQLEKINFQAADLSK